MKCYKCDFFCSGDVSWTDDLIKCWCDYIHTGVTIKKPEAWEEGDPLPDCVSEIDLGSATCRVEKFKGATQ